MVWQCYGQNGNLIWRKIIYFLLLFSNEQKSLESLGGAMDRSFGGRNSRGVDLHAS